MHLSISLGLLRPLFFVRLFFDNPLSWPSSLSPPSLYSFFSLILVLLVVADLPRSPVPCSTLRHFARSSSYFIPCSRSLPVLSSRSLEFAIRLRKSRLPHHLGRALRTRDTCTTACLPESLAVEIENFTRNNRYTLKSFRRRL